MKQNKVNKITIVLMLITVLVVLVGILALARYTTTVSTTGNAVVAAWKFDAKDKSGTTISSTPINLADTITGTVDGTKLATKRIAPGTKGEFIIDVDASDSEVGVDYTVALNNFAITKGGSTTTMPANIKFSYKEGLGDVNYFSLTGSPLAWSITRNFAANASSKTQKITIYWEWPYQTGSTEAEIANNDEKDTTDEGKNITFDVVVTGNQVNPGLGV